MIDSGKIDRADPAKAAQANAEFSTGVQDLTDVEQRVTVVPIYNDYLPLFFFLTNDPWFSTQLSSPVPGAGPQDSFSAVVPVGASGGAPNIGVTEDRWAWITAPNVGVIDTYKQWQPTHQVINLADVTNLGLLVPWPLPTKDAISRFATWTPS